MNRREFILQSSIMALLLGVGLNSCNGNANLSTEKLKSLSGKISKKNLFFLLRRATLGFSIEQFNELENRSVEEVLDKLLNTAAQLTQPLNFEFNEDRLVPIGKTWINAPYRTDVFYEQYRKKSLRAWLASSTFENKCSLQQQLLFFWLNFYSISDVIEHKYEYEHILYLHQHYLGNFKEITKAIAIDPAMLRFLSGFENTKENPNENFARELLELFTVGRGELAGKGDYTTFTEKDVSAIAKALSGWTDTGWYTENPTEKIGTKFVEENHDKNSKQLSSRFNNAVIENNNEKELQNVIDLIFEKKETAIHFCKRLYKWFCADEITAKTEKEIIFPLAQLMIANNYEVKPVLAALLSSEHFFSLTETSARIKNPIQYTFDLLNFFPLEVPKAVNNYYTFWNETFDSMMKMGMELLKPPSVGGWKAYYQSPGYSRLWINAASLKSKKQFIDKLTGIDESWTKSGVVIHYQKIIQASKANNCKELIHFLNLFLFNGLLNTDLQNNLKGLLMKDHENSSEETIIEKLKAGEEPLIRNFKNMTNHLFNLPMLNIH